MIPMKLVCMSFFLSVSSFSMTSAFASVVNDRSSSVIRNSTLILMFLHHLASIHVMCILVAINIKN